MRKSSSAVYNKKRRDERTTKGICANCGKRRISNKSKRHCFTCVKQFRAYQNKIKVKYRIQRASYQDQLRDQLRIAAFNAYGGALCNCCGEDIDEFLEMDHINNDGAAQRHSFKKQGTWNWIYSWLKKNNYPSGFQVLCSNCNKAKWRYGQCPHEVDDEW